MDVKLFNGPPIYVTLQLEWATTKLISAKLNAGDVSKLMQLPRNIYMEPISDEKLGEFIRQVAKLIETCGWVQFAAGDTVQGFCVIGAMNHVYLLRNDIGYAQEAAQRFIHWLQERGEAYPTIPAWNDAPGRVQEEVLLHLYKFAEELAPEQPTT